MSTGRTESRLLELLTTMSSPARGSLAAPCIGVVSAVDAKTGYVKLAYESLSVEKEGPHVGSDWTPVVLPMAGNGRAVSFLPKPGDQALVVFVNGDWSTPVVMGFLPSEQDPLPPEFQNGKAGAILGPEGPRVVLEETSNDGGPSVVISDGNGKNRIVIRTEGNTVEITAGNIVLSALDGNVSIKAKTIALESSEGTTVKAAGLDVTASEALNLKGSTVNIN